MYIATRKVNTEFGSYDVGELVSDEVGIRYSAFKKMETPKKVKKTKEAKEAKEVKEEILTEVSANVQVEITKE